MCFYFSDCLHVDTFSHLLTDGLSPVSKPLFDADSKHRVAPVINGRIQVSFLTLPNTMDTTMDSNNALSFIGSTLLSSSTMLPSNDIQKTKQAL